jgi:hypothetical protein
MSAVAGTFLLQRIAGIAKRLVGLELFDDSALLRSLVVPPQARTRGLLCPDTSALMLKAL